MGIRSGGAFTILQMLDYSSTLAEETTHSPAAHQIVPGMQYIDIHFAPELSDDPEFLRYIGGLTNTDTA